MVRSKQFVIVLMEKSWFCIAFFSSILSKWLEVRICIILSVFPLPFLPASEFYIEGINLSLKFIKIVFWLCKYSSMFSTSFNVEISFKILTVRNLEEQKHHLGQYLIFLFLFGNLSLNIQQGFIYVVKAMVFPVVMYGCESWTIKKAEHWKNWCIQIVVLEKTLESPLDSKEIKLVNPKENQPWIFIGRTDAEAEAPILWPPVAKSWLIGKDPDTGKTEGRGRKGWQRMRWLGGITDSIDMSLCKLQEIMQDSKAWHAALHEVAKNRIWLNDQTTMNICVENISVSEVAQSCPTLCDPMDCSLPGSSIHRIFQARVLE